MKSLDAKIAAAADQTLADIAFDHGSPLLKLNGSSGVSKFDLSKVPLGTFDIFHKIWYPNFNLKMSIRHQRKRNIDNGHMDETWMTGRFNPHDNTKSTDS